MEHNNTKSGHFSRLIIFRQSQFIHNHHQRRWF